MKKIYLTFDIETIVSGFSKSSNYLSGVYLSAMTLADELYKRNLKATFYISLSSKQDNLSQTEYFEFLKLLIRSLKSYHNIQIEPHIHALNIPMNFETRNDEFNKYDVNQQTELLKFAKSFFIKQGINVKSFRPGGFNANDSYYDALKNADYKYSSLLRRDLNINIDLLNGKVIQSSEFLTENGIIEYPVTSVKIKSIKGNIEILNLSPDFFTLESIKDQFVELNYVNINFHSFSFYINRLIRENHKNQFWENVKFFFFENNLNKILNKFSIQTINTNTVIANEYIKWLNFIKEENFNTFFIGE